MHATWCIIHDACQHANMPRCQHTNMPTCHIVNTACFNTTCYLLKTHLKKKDRPIDRAGVFAVIIVDSGDIGCARKLSKRIWNLSKIRLCTVEILAPQKENIKILNVLQVLCVNWRIWAQTCASIRFSLFSLQSSIASHVVPLSSFDGLFPSLCCLGDLSLLGRPLLKNLSLALPVSAWTWLDLLLNGLGYLFQDSLQLVDPSFS